MRAQHAPSWNNKALHDKLEEQARTSIVRAAEAKVPNVITLFGARRGMSDQEGIDNCITGLNRVKKFAEDHGVTLCIDTTLHLLAGMLGQHVADETARIMEYTRAWRANREGFAAIVV